MSRIETGYWTLTGHGTDTCISESRRAAPESRPKMALFGVFNAEMESVLVLITLWNLVLYEIANHGNEFCPNSQF